MIPNCSSLGARIRYVFFKLFPPCSTWPPNPHIRQHIWDFIDTNCWSLFIATRFGRTLYSFKPFQVALYLITVSSYPLISYEIIEQNPNQVCRVWETKKGREMNCYMDHDGIIISISFAPDGNSAVSASADKTLRIWKAADASPIHTLKGHTGIVLSCAYRSDGKYIVSNDERILRVWDALNGTCTLSLSVDEVPRPNTLPGKKQTWTLSSYCPGTLGFYIIAACNSKTIHVFHPETGEEILAYYCKAPVYCLSCGSHSKVCLFGIYYCFSFVF